MRFPAFARGEWSQSTRFIWTKCLPSTMTSSCGENVKYEASPLFTERTSCYTLPFFDPIWPQRPPINRVFPVSRDIRDSCIFVEEKIVHHLVSPSIFGNPQWGECLPIHPDAHETFENCRGVVDVRRSFEKRRPFTPGCSGSTHRGGRACCDVSAISRQWHQSHPLRPRPFGRQTCLLGNLLMFCSGTRSSGPLTVDGVGDDFMFCRVICNLF